VGVAAHLASKRVGKPVGKDLLDVDGLGGWPVRHAELAEVGVPDLLEDRESKSVAVVGMVAGPARLKTDRPSRCTRMRRGEFPGEGGENLQSNLLFPVERFHRLVAKFFKRDGVRLVGARNDNGHEKSMSSQAPSEGRRGGLSVRHRSLAGA